MVVGNHQCNAASLNQSKAQFQLELSLAQFSTSNAFKDGYLLNYYELSFKLIKIFISNIRAHVPGYRLLYFLKGPVDVKRYEEIKIKNVGLPDF